MAVDIAVVGTGGRAGALLDSLYEVRDREYLWGEYYPPSRLDAYHDHAEEVPWFAESVADLDPSVTALFDPDPGALASAADRCGEAGDDPRTFEDWAAFLASDAYDAAIVASPNDVHVENVRPLLERDVPVLCEKPVATTLADHDALIAAAADSGAVCYPGLNLRSSPYFAHLRGLLAGGAVGELGTLTCHEVRGPFGTDFRYDSERSGGALLEKNVHDFDLFNWFADADPQYVTAFGGQHVFARDSDIVDQASVVVEYEGGVLGTLELCLYAEFGQRKRRYELRGSEGLLRSPDEKTAIDHYTVDRAERIDVHTEEMGSHMGGDRCQMARFLRCVRGEADPPGDLVDAKKAAAVALAAERAVAERAVVELTPEYDVA